jgi:trans-aconitate 2-methyltransferase
VLDAGCGSGRVTAQLLARLPRGHVVGVDISPAMLAEARAQNPAERFSAVEADLAALPPMDPVDAVFSVAAFHWVASHDALFESLARVMRPGAALASDCGGAGQLAHVYGIADEIIRRRPFADATSPVEEYVNFAGAEETAARLEQAGFSVDRVWLEPSPSAFESSAAFRAYLRTVVLRPHLNALPEALREPFLDEMEREDERRGGERTVDYIRLNIAARRR